MEWDNGRITKPPATLLKFHQKALAQHVEVPRLVTYHQERIDYLSSLATIHTLHSPLDQANIIFLDDYRGGNAA